MNIIGGPEKFNKENLLDAKDSFGKKKRDDKIRAAGLNPEIFSFAQKPEQKEAAEMLHLAGNVVLAIEISQKVDPEDKKFKQKVEENPEMIARLEQLKYLWRGKKNEILISFANGITVKECKERPLYYLALAEVLEERADSASK